MRPLVLLLCLALGLPAAAQTRPKPRPVADPIPVTQWDFRPESDRWSLAAIDALRGHGQPLVEHTPDDIAGWCPGYEHAGEADRRAFWVGFLSALARYESTWRPRAVGGGGQWYGLLQILPSTARFHGCRAGTGAALQDGAANLACAVRIMSRTVPRDGVVHARAPRWLGVSADWGPMRSDAKREAMRKWLRGQSYCQMTASPRPMPRPGTVASGGVIGLWTAPAVPGAPPVPDQVIARGD